MSTFMGVQKVGEGFSRPDPPININYSKLLEWLVDRKKLPLQWKKQLKPIRDKIAAAVANLPSSPEISAFLVDRTLTYADCDKMMALLEAANESASKNLFGQYASKRMGEWAEIKKMYEKDNIFLGEAANLLISLVNYDIPALKKTADKSQKQITDLEKREIEWAKNAQSFQMRFKQECTNFGIEGKDVKEELLGMICDIPALLQVVENAVKGDKVLQAYTFYKEFTAFMSQTEASQLEDSLPYLQYMMKHGNDTLDIMGRRKRGEVIEEAKVEVKQEKALEEAAAPIEVDWTVIDEQPSGVAIDWDISIESSSQEPAVIWDLDASIDTDTIEVVDAAASTAAEQEDTALQMETILENTKSRNEFLNDILELQNFFQQRIAEVNTEEEGIALNVFEGGPSSVRNQNAKALNEYLSAVKGVVSALEADKLRKLFEIKNSKRYVDRIASDFQHLLECVDQSNNSIAEAALKKDELQHTISEAYPKMEVEKSKVRELKSHIEKALCLQFPGQEVHLTGDITKLL